MRVVLRFGVRLPFPVSRNFGRSRYVRGCLRCPRCVTRCRFCASAHCLPQVGWFRHCSLLYWLMILRVYTQTYKPAQSPGSPAVRIIFLRALSQRPRIAKSRRSPNEAGQTGTLSALITSAACSPFEPRGGTPLSTAAINGLLHGGSIPAWWRPYSGRTRPGGEGSRSGSPP